MSAVIEADILTTVENITTEQCVEEEVVKNIVEVSSDNTFVLPASISVSIPVQHAVQQQGRDMLKNVEVMDNNGQTITLDSGHIVEVRFCCSELDAFLLFIIVVS